MNSMVLSKEVTYVFKYAGDTGYSHHFIDNIEGRRYISEDLQDPRMAQPQQFKGTGKPESTIEAVLVAERIMREIPDSDGGVETYLLYFLPDINIYVSALHSTWYDTAGLNVLRFLD
ncbi:hypothetical protein ACUXCC_002298 [Cytobacillus horneckiae]|uniref:hypothetical protein n=1 Tax=Cytobacillus horneckiae TaxID=549687 RepID=UPI0019D21DAA|nr:hypothetical protein [Cytobacillus horneckiae]MBN6887276.1 hypothetical protein [Cytobacillus horneckiae]MCM3178131.1 hypothetical protein [Cytobacillus horneckiae]